MYSPIKIQKFTLNNIRPFKSLHLSKSLSLTKIIIGFFQSCPCDLDIFIIFNAQLKTIHYPITNYNIEGCLLMCDGDTVT